MGTFQVQMEIGDPQGGRYEPIDVLVDSGATYTLLPGSLLQRLGVRPYSTRTFELADGSRIHTAFGSTWARLDGELSITPVVFGDDDVQPLLGAVTLEIFSLGIDPVNSRLIPVVALLLATQVRDRCGGQRTPTQQVQTSCARSRVTRADGSSPRAFVHCPDARSVELATPGLSIPLYRRTHT